MMDGVLFLAILEWRTGHRACNSSGLRSGMMLVESKSLEGVSGSDAMASLREGWDGSGE